MRILHMIWLPFAYWFFPYQLANHALRGTLKQYGIDLRVIPNELSQEISANIIRLQKLNPRKSGVLANLEQLHLLIDHDAIIMKSIIRHEYKYEFEFTPEVERIKNIMLKHAARKIKK
ncbi:hypothetical protein K5D27_18265 [Acinetobacter baumannii]|nr:MULTISPECIES: hypothetical protein [Acinetobacter]MDB0280398.1 hypothetical protein [Acinetobacter seifertii]EFF86451.1 hypothetical protein HMPREF0013_01784 [Acinetobacter sp. SH024]EKW2152309.1 hypothetical protein [Acinetobacter baumannii]KQE96303.1 hypothetical protein APB99_18625 [Acinetobacter pittii]KQE96913.1 hypothetical protein APB99_01245 [Acinetobacter pittii]